MAEYTKSQIIAELESLKNIKNIKNISDLYNKYFIKYIKIMHTKTTIKLSTFLPPLLILF